MACNCSDGNTNGNCSCNEVNITVVSESTSSCSSCSCGDITLPVGPKGDTGSQGIQGIQGVQGDQGEQGIQGEQGETGQGIDHVSLTDTDPPVNTYTIWGDAGETINLGTFDVTDGTDGIDALSTTQCLIFKRSAIALAQPTGGNFNFTSQTLTAPATWYNYIPAGTDPCYVSIGQATITGSTGIDNTITWSVPTICFQDGVDGLDGFVYEILDGGEIPAEATLADQILKRNSTNDGYEFADLRELLIAYGVSVESTDYSSF